MNWYKTLTAAVTIDPQTGREVVVDDNSIDNEVEKQWGKSRGGGVIMIDRDKPGGGGGDGGTAGAAGTTTLRDLGKTKGKSEDDVRSLFQPAEIPMGWDKFTVAQKGKWLARSLSSGIVNYPIGVHKDLMAIATFAKGVFDPIIAKSISVSGKIPNFMKEWISEKKLIFLPETQAAVMAELAKLPQDHRKIYNLYAA